MPHSCPIKTTVQLSITSIRHLHYNNNTLDVRKDHPDYNKMYKIQPLVDHFCHVFQSAVVPETFMSVDEMMVASKGRHSAKVYMPKKPTKWGYKLWSRTGISGYMYIFHLYSAIKLEHNHTFW